MLTVETVKTADDLDAVKRLCWEYRAMLLGMGPQIPAFVAAVYSESAYQEIMDRMGADHAARPGSVKIVKLDGAPVGCGMFHAFDADTAEVKRVFIRDGARGSGAGRGLMEALIAACRAQGFSRIVLDTAKALAPAAALYHAVGFTPCGPYQTMPDGAGALLLFFEMTL